MTRLDQLKRKIEEAFADVPYPGDRRICSDPDYWESAEIIERFRGRHWKEVARDVLQYHQHDLPFFSPEGLRYYLPAYLFAALEPLGDTLEFTLYEVDPDTEDDGFWAERHEPMTPAQKNAIRMWLEYVRDEMPRYMDRPTVQAALDKYWGREWE
ncbi:MAG TPA: DUF6714 family protein [Myxococcaceae bacterium]|nr:DUF6714 family protein [Myxococcaceae bacterium]